MPEWLERLTRPTTTSGRISRAHLQEIHEIAIKAALKDQEKAGVDIVSDGELRRDNDVDYFLARMPGVEIAETGQGFYYDYYDVTVAARVPRRRHHGTGARAGRGPRFTRAYTDRPVKFSFTGPFSLLAAAPQRGVRRPRRAGAGDRAGAQRRGPGAGRGGRGAPADRRAVPGRLPRAGRAARSRPSTWSPRAWTPTWALHVCYGNRYARPLWEGHYDFLFPAVLDAQVDQLVLEFARKGDDDLALFERSAGTARSGWA